MYFFYNIYGYLNIKMIIKLVKGELRWRISRSPCTPPAFITTGIRKYPPTPIKIILYPIYITITIKKPSLTPRKIITWKHPYSGGTNPITTSPQGPTISLTKSSTITTIVSKRRCSRALFQPCIPQISTTSNDRWPSWKLNR